MGGDRRSQRIEAHADFILAQIEKKPDMTIMELREKIRERHGLGCGYGTVWQGCSTLFIESVEQHGRGILSDG